MKRHDCYTIHVWRWEDAPERYKQQDFGGDEDWVAFVPAELAGEYIPWLEVPAFGVCRVERFPAPGGEIVLGGHA